MQIISPDMLPFVKVFVILFLATLGIIGLISLRSGLKSFRISPRKVPSIGKMLFGISALGFVMYNGYGYQTIFVKNEQMIVGQYACGRAVLSIESDRKWEIISEDKSISKRGKWQYVMSEDWCYWDFESNDVNFNAQTGSSKRVDFKKQHLYFKKVKTRNRVE
ncbi:MAG: hypothetical protein RL632_1031 [Bacteroidota bacterium]|jgi:hypothetical protein